MTHTETTCTGVLMTGMIHTGDLDMWVTNIGTIPGMMFHTGTMSSTGIIHRRTHTGMINIRIISTGLTKTIMTSTGTIHPGVPKTRMSVTDVTEPSTRIPGSSIPTGNENRTGHHIAAVYLQLDILRGSVMCCVFVLRSTFQKQQPLSGSSGSSHCCS